MAKLPTQVARRGIGIGGSTPIPTLLTSTFRPNIPGAPSTRAVLVRPDIEAVNLGPFIQSVTRLGLALDQKDSERKAFEQSMWVETASSEASLFWSKWMADNERNPPPDLVENLNSAFSDYAAKLLSTSPSDEATLAVTKNLNRIHLRMFGQSMQIEARTRAQQTLLGIDNIMENARDDIIVTKDPGMLDERIMSTKLVINQALAVNKISPEIHAKLIESIEDFPVAFALSVVADNPQVALDVINDIDTYPGISPARREQVRGAARRVMKTTNDLVKAQQDQLLASNLSMIERTGEASQSFDIGFYEKVHGKGAAFKAKNNIAVAHGFFSARQELLDRPAVSRIDPETQESIESLVDILEKHRPKTGDKLFNLKSRVFDQLQTLVKNQEALLKDNPFMYAMQNPVVKKFYDDFQLVGDDDKAGQFMAFLNASINHQKELGVTEENLSVMSDRQAIDLAGIFRGAGADQIEDELLRLETTYGKFFPMAMRDMARLPSGQRIDTMIQIIGLHRGATWTNDLVQAVRTNEKDYNLSSEETSDLGEELADNNSLTSLRAAIMSSNPNLAGYADDFWDITRKYAMSLFARGEEKTMRKAVRLASDRVITSKYAFGDNHNDRVYAILKEHTDDSGMKRDFTDDELKSIRHAIRPTFFRRTPSEPAVGIVKSHINPELIDNSEFVTPLRRNEIGQIVDVLSKEDILKIVRNQIRAGFWVTRPDNEGITLYSDSIGGLPEPMLFTNGDAVTFSFTEILKLKIPRRKTEIPIARSFDIVHGLR